MLKKLNLNSIIKIKLTPHGAEIYYNQNEELIEIIKEKGLKPYPIEKRMPEIDKNGYTKMQLWCFIQLYGDHIGMGFQDVVKDCAIYIDESDIEEVKE